MKATVRQYIPSFFEGYTPATAEVETLSELFELEWVKKFKVEDFVRFAKNVEKDGSATIIAEYPREKYIVGFVDDANFVKKLPKVLL